MTDTSSDPEATTTTMQSSLTKAGLAVAIITTLVGAGVFAHKDIQANQKRMAQEARAAAAIAAQEDTEVMREFFNPEPIRAPAESLQSVEGAMALGNELIGRKHNQSLELEGITAVPDKRITDIIGRALSLGHDSIFSCAVRLTEQSGEHDYKTALAMSAHFQGKVCVPSTAKVQSGLTLADLYLQGEFTPINVHVLGLESGKSLHDPAEIARREEEQLMRALSGKSAHPYMHRATGGNAIEH